MKKAFTCVIALARCILDYFMGALVLLMLLPVWVDLVNRDWQTYILPALLIYCVSLPYSIRKGFVSFQRDIEMHREMCQAMEEMQAAHEAAGGCEDCKTPCQGRAQ